MRKTNNNPYISSPQCAMREAWVANWGAGSVENLASEPSEPAGVLLIKGKARKRNWEEVKMIYKQIHEKYIISVMDAICYAYISAVLVGGVYWDGEE